MFWGERTAEPRDSVGAPANDGPMIEMLKYQERVRALDEMKALIAARTKALELANNHPEPADMVVARAAEYERFLTGRE